MTKTVHMELSAEKLGDLRRVWRQGAVSAEGRIDLEFEPGAASVKVDYSKEDRVGVTIEGRFLPRPDLEAQGSVRLGLDGKHEVEGSLRWEISKDVAAQVEVNQDGAVGRLTVKF